jgi:battenin
MVIIAMTPSYTDGGAISTKLVGVVLASLSSGGGELSFLSMTHFYGPFSLAFWGSGTGAAGLIGAGAYALATTSLGFSVTATLLASACLPAFMLLSFFVILPRGPLSERSTNISEYHAVSRQEDDPAANGLDDDDMEASGDVNAGLLGQSRPRVSSTVQKPSSESGHFRWWALFKANLTRSKGLFFPL